jgi:hypothetical protein
MILIFAGKKYYWWTNARNTKVDKKYYRTKYNAIFGDPIESKRFKTIKKAREDGKQIGVYVENKEDAHEILWAKLNKPQENDKRIEEMENDTGEF